MNRITLCMFMMVLMLYGANQLVDRFSGKEVCSDALVVTPQGLKNLHIVNQFIDEGLNRKNFFVLDDVVSEDLLWYVNKDKQIISDIQHLKRKIIDTHRTDPLYTLKFDSTAIYPQGIVGYWKGHILENGLPANKPAHEDVEGVAIFIVRDGKIQKMEFILAEFPNSVHNS
jgi:hypothetical protein